MPLPVSPLRHRLQAFGAILISVGSVFFVSRVVKHRDAAAHGCSHGQMAPILLPAVTSPLSPPVMFVPQAAPDDTAGTALKRAAASGDAKEVERVLDSGANVHVSETEPDAPLLQADAYPAVVTLLLKRGAQEPDLSTACIAGAPNAVTRILAQRKTANPEDGTTPLYDAIASTLAMTETRRIIVDKLLAAGADPNVGEGSTSPLQAAVGTCDSDGVDACRSLIRALQKKGAKSDGPTIIAAVGADPTVLDELLARSLQPGATAVALASGGGLEPATVKKIASKGVAWAWKDGEPNSAAPLVDAVDLVDVDLVRSLLDAGAPADLHLKDGRCALGQAIDATSNNAVDAARIVELLVARGANPNRRLPDGRSPLFAAAETGETRIVTALLDAGARVNDKVLDETALDAAERNGQTPAARVLDSRGGRRAPPRVEE